MLFCFFPCRGMQLGSVVAAGVWDVLVKPKRKSLPPFVKHHLNSKAALRDICLKSSRLFKYMLIFFFFGGGV